MEVIKKVIKRVDTIIKTNDCEDCGIIVPDTGVTYYMKISLTQEAPDIGFFNAFELPIILPSEVYDKTNAVETATTPTSTTTGESVVPPIVPPVAGTPTVTTGNLYLTTSIYARISENVVNNNGGLPIIEYGILYTENIAYGTSSTLIYGASTVNKSSTMANISISTNYTENIYPEDPTLSTRIYYRAFARNAENIGYGDVKIVDFEGSDVR